MTSPENNDEIIDYFKKKNFYGIDSSLIQFFEQPMMPAITDSGKIILENKGKIFLAPNGNGGVFDTILRDKSIFDEM